MLRRVAHGLVGAGALRLGRVASLEPSAAQLRVAAAALLVGRAAASSPSPTPLLPYNNETGWLTLWSRTGDQGNEWRDAAVADFTAGSCGVEAGPSQPEAEEDPYAMLPPAEAHYSPGHFDRRYRTQRPLPPLKMATRNSAIACGSRASKQRED